ncbi:tyrosine-type recombinase/integrase [Shewanella sp. SM101]|uniref:tyrosine-type recombinase/integrase n=1 Tax=Shewanella TaxID=22 RepID=UPI0002112E4F|nr:MULTISPECIES: tyrosine-type recombinase/integrase [Shewanella]AEH16262.1 integrase family protein [Shewanella baltica OS117]MCU8008988.1 tyrosine-type recombinase/integrase [Shewanella sp. SM87]MCU8107224.1 tyrosine-type recombinase/integrase [Shewanella sp. SM101]
MRLITTTATIESALAVVSPVEPISIADSLKDDHQRLVDELRALLALPHIDLTDTHKKRITQITQRLVEHFFDIGLKTKPKNTWTAFNSRWNTYKSWCLTEKLTPLPSSPGSVAAFLLSKSDNSYTTLTQYCWAINMLHTECGLPSPIHSQTVKGALNTLKLTKLEQGDLEAVQATPFRLTDLQTISAQWGQSDKLLDLRNAAMLNVAYETMLRESELLRIKVRDIKRTATGRFSLSVSYTKTNRTGEADIVIISRGCWEAVNRYMSKAALLKHDDYLFQPIGRKSEITIRPTPLDTRIVDRVFGAAFTLAGHELMDAGYRAWSGHSARVGAAQDLLAQGYSFPQVQQAGRWSTPLMVLRYGKDILAEESAMARMMNDYGVTKK